jgi:hypothetical protein
MAFPYKKIDETDIAYIKSVMAAERVFVGEEIPEEYYHDEMPEYGIFAPEVYVEVINKEEIQEKDSIAGNKKAGEDDMSSASLIISVKTGSPAMYIGIVLISLIVLGLGIYTINRKILKV